MRRGALSEPEKNDLRVLRILATISTVLLAIVAALLWAIHSSLEETRGQINAIRKAAYCDNVEPPPFCK
jgi:hypothetical protein